MGKPRRQSFLRHLVTKSAEEGASGCPTLACKSGPSRTGALQSGGERERKRKQMLLAELNISVHASKHIQEALWAVFLAEGSWPVRTGPTMVVHQDAFLLKDGGESGGLGYFCPGGLREKSGCPKMPTTTAQIVRPITGNSRLDQCSRMLFMHTS